MLKMAEIQIIIGPLEGEIATTIIKAIRPELISAPSDRVNISLESEGEELTFHITAEDITALRAAVNAYLRWVMVTRDMFLLGREA